MSTKQIDAKAIASHQPTEPPHIKATFAGTYYKSVGGNAGKEFVPFEHTVKFPLSAVQAETYTPVALYRKYKEKTYMKKLGGAGVRQIYLVKVEGDLPRMSLEHELNWTASYQELLDLALKAGEKHYTKINRQTEARERASVFIRPELFPSPDELRFGLKLLMDDPEAFDMHQERLAKADGKIPKNMEADIAALMSDD